MARRGQQHIATNPITRFRRELAKQVGEACDISHYGYVPSQELFPCVFVVIDEAESITTGDAAFRVTGRIVALVGSGINETAQEHIDRLLVGASAVTAAVNSDRSVGGTVSQIAIERSESLALTKQGASTAWGHSWTFLAITQRRPLNA